MEALPIPYVQPMFLENKLLKFHKSKMLFQN